MTEAANQESHLAPAACCASEAKYRALVEESEDVVCSVDAQGIFTYVGPQVGRYGFDPSRLIGTSFLDILHPEDRERLAQDFQEVLTTGREFRSQFRVLKPGGGIVWFEDSARIRRDASGEITEFLLTVRDISDRKRTETALRESEEMLRTVMATALDAIVMMNAEGQITLWNAAAERMFGYSPEEVLGRDLHRLIARPGDYAKHQAGFARFRRSGEGPAIGRVVELTAVAKGGLEIPVELSVSPVRLGGQWHAVGIVRDVAGRKRAEYEARRRVEEVERFNRLALAREDRVRELKREVNGLALSAGQAPPYSLDARRGDSFVSADPPNGLSLLDPAEEAIEPRLADLIDLGQMQELLDNLCDAMGISAAIIEPCGVVLVAARWRRICTAFHRSNDRTRARCIHSDTILARQLREGEPLSCYRCGNGLTDAASPIVIDGHHVGNVFVGQLLLGPADEDFFRRQAARFGFDEEEYLHALCEVPVVSKERLSAVLASLAGLARLVASIGLERLRARAAEKRLRQRAEDVNRTNRELERQRQAAIGLAEDANRARVEAERARATLSGLFLAVPVGIGVLDERRRFLSVNERICGILGYTQEDLLGRTTRIIYVSDREFDRVGRSLYANLRQNGHAAEEVRLRCKDGTELLAVMNAAMLDPQDLTAGVVFTILDITDRKQAEEELRGHAEALRAANGELENQKLNLEAHRQQLLAANEQMQWAIQLANDMTLQAKSANVAKSQFLANVSHEIRTPMMAILGYAELLAGGLTDPEHCEAVNTIRRNGDHLLTVINDILDVSKIEAGELRVEKAPCALPSLLAEVAELMRLRAHAKNIALKLEYAGPIPRSIVTDSTRLRQILVNLLGNAVKFTEVGEVRMIASLADRETDAPKFLCAVIDTGIGMSPDEVGKLFQPFHQIDSSCTRKHGGTGLGLAISKRLALALGGDITVRSKPGEGSAFTLTLPAGPLGNTALLGRPEPKCPEAAAPRPQSVPAALLDCRVLLAEDGPDNQRFIATVLRKAGGNVTVVENGHEAVKAALAVTSDPGEESEGPDAPFDVILMDMQMPVMDGYEATRCLRRAGYRGPIVALTAHAMSDDARKCLDAGCDDYATKPIDRNRLVGLVASHRAGNRPHEDLALTRPVGDKEPPR